MNPRHLLRAEGVAVFAAATAAYYVLDGPFWLYLLLFFAPDLGMFGYVSNSRIGSQTYNVTHTYVLPIALFGFGIWQAIPSVTLAAAIWVAHIGFDRALGYGLKFPTAFDDTHLGHYRFTATDDPTAEMKTESESEVSHLPR